MQHVLTFMPWAILAAAALAGDRPVEADLYTHVANAFANPEAASRLPRVLIIGDSISIGYTDVVRKNLKGIADVYRPPVNCQHSAYGLAHVKAWLGTGRWDVVHFNFGIWDTHLLDAHGALVRSAQEDPAAPGIRIRLTPEQYTANLAQMVASLRNTGARLIWASTTPVLCRTGERLNVIPAYNEHAAAVMRAGDVAIDDLYALVLPRAREWQQPDRCHFNDRGNAELGKQVSASIRQALGR